MKHPDTVGFFNTFHAVENAKKLVESNRIRVETVLPFGCSGIAAIHERLNYDFCYDNIHRYKL